MTLAEMRATLYDRLGYKSTPDDAVIRRLDGFLNETQRELAGMRGLARLRRNILTFASVANSPFAVLPQAAVRIAGIQDRNTQRALVELSIQDLRFMDPGLTNIASNPSNYVILNMSAPLAAEPSTADAVYIKSDDAGDVCTAYIQGIITGGYYQTRQVTMTGVTAVAFPLSNWMAITKVFLSAVAVGTVTINQTSGAGAELGRIASGKSKARYTRIQLYGTPSQSLTYYADVDVHIEDLTAAMDESYIPEDYAWLLPCGALKKEYVKRKDEMEYNIEQARWKNGTGELKAFCRSVTDTGRGGSGDAVAFNSPDGQIWPRV